MVEHLFNKAYTVRESTSTHHTKRKIQKNRRYEQKIRPSIASIVNYTVEIAIQELCPKEVGNAVVCLQVGPLIQVIVHSKKSMVCIMYRAACQLSLNRQSCLFLPAPSLSFLHPMISSTLTPFLFPVFQNCCPRRVS
jgi:hypothetical protein